MGEDKAMGFTGGVVSDKFRAVRVLLTAFGGVTLTLLLLATATPADSARAETVQIEHLPSLSMSGELVPATLPRSQLAPITLRIGFEFPPAGNSRVPELNSIALDFARNIRLQTTGLPSCSLGGLLSSYGNPVKTCKGSLVGHGSVTSEIALPGQAPATVQGALLAFYDFAEGQPRILAEVTTSGAVALTYVIPFTIERGHFGTHLVVQKMSRIQGICARGYPNCFAQPYRLEGIYSRISNFELSLHRVFTTHRGPRESLVSADCPAPGHRSFEDSTFEGVSVTSSSGGQSATLLGRCKVAG